MLNTTQIEPKNWKERINLFSLGNRGRLVSMTLCNFETLIDSIPLMNIDYDSLNLGCDMVVSVGTGTVKLNHIINSPLELWETKNERGDTTSMEIIDYDNNEFVLVFSS